MNAAQVQIQALLKELEALDAQALDILAALASRLEEARPSLGKGELAELDNWLARAELAKQGIGGFQTLAEQAARLAKLPSEGANGKDSQRPAANNWEKWIGAFKDEMDDDYMKALNRLRLPENGGDGLE